MVAKQQVVCLRGIVLSLLWNGLGRISLTHISLKHSSLLSLSLAKHRSLGEDRWWGILSCMRGLIASFATKLNCSGLVICPSLEIDLVTFDKLLRASDNCESNSTTTLCPASSR